MPMPSLRGMETSATQKTIANINQPKETEMHASTFDYHKPTEKQTIDMGDARAAAAGYARALEALLPDGPDKTYVIRKLREVAMWANIAITRQPDGTPR
jgi:hypothetical protein